MKKIIAILCLFLLFLTVSFAQDTKEAAIERINARRVAFITEQLALSASEAQVFWPVYNAYKKETRAIRKQVKKHGRIENMTDTAIEQHLEDKLAAEAASLQLKRELMTELKGLLPIKKVAKLFQAERNFKEWMFKQIRKKARG